MRSNSSLQLSIVLLAFTSLVHSLTAKHVRLLLARRCGGDGRRHDISAHLHSYTRATAMQSPADHLHWAPLAISARGEHSGFCEHGTSVVGRVRVESHTRRPAGKPGRFEKLGTREIPIFTLPDEVVHAERASTSAEQCMYTTAGGYLNVPLLTCRCNTPTPRKLHSEYT